MCYPGRRARVRGPAAGGIARGLQSVPQHARAPWVGKTQRNARHAQPLQTERRGRGCAPLRSFDQAANGMRRCSSASASVLGAAGICSTVAVWPGISSLSIMIWPSVPRSRAS